MPCEYKQKSHACLSLLTVQNNDALQYKESCLQQRSAAAYRHGTLQDTVQSIHIALIPPQSWVMAPYEVDSLAFVHAGALPSPVGADTKRL